MLKRTAVVVALIGLISTIVTGIFTLIINFLPLELEKTPSIVPTNPVLADKSPQFVMLSPTDAISNPGVACPWIPYLNGMPASALNTNSQNCLDDLGYGIDGNEKQLSFFLDGSPLLGRYGVCKDISRIGDINLHVELRDNIAFSRFLISVGPEPVPGKSSYGIRIQAEAQPRQAKEIYVKLIEYTAAGYGKEKGQLRAISDWKYNDKWDFYVAFQFAGSKMDTSINKSLSGHWQMNYASRYLCFTYEAMPTPKQAAQLEVHVSTP
jgi:hypothetical protein